MYIYIKYKTLIAQRVIFRFLPNLRRLKKVIIYNVYITYFLAEESQNDLSLSVNQFHLFV